MASFKNLEAALLTLQAQALKHYGAIEILINNPVGLAGVIKKSFNELE